MGGGQNYEYILFNFSIVAQLELVSLAIASITKFKSYQILIAGTTMPKPS